MMSVIEDTVMVNSINNDANNFKRVDVDNKPQRPQHQVKRDSYLPETSSVSLSNASKEISALKDLVKHAPDVDSQRVEHLKQEVAAGRYQVTSGKIASLMLDDIGQVQ